MSDYRYNAEMNVLRKVADELGVVMYFPNYHRAKGDKNTVLFYFKEDHDYNERVDKEYPGLSQSTRDEMYRHYFWSFSNTDRNGELSYDYANHGSIDLLCLDWRKRLTSAVELAYYRRLQNTYIRTKGGVLSMNEADDFYNDQNRLIIRKYFECYQNAWVGKFNEYDIDRRKDIAEGRTDALTKYNGEFVYNGQFDFIVRDNDKKLNALIRDRLMRKDNDQDKIFDRIEILGGIVFLWK